MSNLNMTGRGEKFVQKNGRINDDEFEKMASFYHDKFIKEIIISGQKFSKNAQCTLVYPDGSVYITPYDNEEYQLLIENILEENPRDVFSRLREDHDLWNDYTYRYRNTSLTRK